MKIIQFQPDDSAFVLFSNLPKQLYDANSIRHRQSDKINREFLHVCFVAVENEQALGRVALFVNPHLQHNQQPACCIGLYECTDDLNVSRALLEAATYEAKKQGAAYMIGSMNGSTWDDYRFSLHHQHPNFLLEPYHHLYYNQQFTDFGFEVLSPYVSAIEYAPFTEDAAGVSRAADLYNKGLRVRHIDLNNYDNELRQLYDFISLAFRSNFLYTPITWETFYQKYSDAKRIIAPERFLIAHDTHDNILGFLFAYDDMFNTQNKTLILKTLARHPAATWAGMGAVLVNQLLKYAMANNYHAIIHAFMISAGNSAVLSKRFAGGAYKEYALYVKQINEK